MGTYIQTLVHWPTIAKYFFKMIPDSAMGAYHEYVGFTHERVSKRIQMEKTRNDLLEGLLMKQDELVSLRWKPRRSPTLARRSNHQTNAAVLQQLTPQDVESHAGLLTVAGSETTATLLSGATFLLLKNPDTLARLTHEIRSAFKSDSDINISSAAHLTYLNACLQEAMRVYPPVPTGLPRIVPKGGRVFSGKFVPEDASL